MNRLLGLLIATCLLLVVVTSGSAQGGVVLNTSAVNIDGTTTVMPAPPPGVDASGFNFATGLGTIRVTVNGAGAHFVGLGVQHVLDFLGFDDFGGTSGTPVAGQSWEIDDLLLGNIVPNLFGSTPGNSLLDNTNSVPFFSITGVAMAMGFDFTLGANETANVGFRISETEPDGGIYLRQTNRIPLNKRDPAGSIYLSGRLDIKDQPNDVIPEPASLAVWSILGAAGVGMGLARRRKRK